MNTAVAILVLIGGIVSVVVVTTLLNGYALSVLWGWFVVPAFGVPALSVPAAIGLAMVVGMMAKQIEINDDDKDQAGKRLAAIFLKPLLALLLGWIVKQWM